MKRSRRIPNARTLLPLLRALGFTLKYDSMGGGVRTAQWERQVGNRKLELQLSDFDPHRVSHFITEPDGTRMCTYPTHFTDVDSMLMAIAVELTRTDHPPR